MENATNSRFHYLNLAVQWQGKLILFIFSISILYDEHKEEFCNSDNLPVGLSGLTSREVAC